MVDHVWPNIHQVLQTLTTQFSQLDRLINVILRQHQYLTTFFQSNGWILDLSLEHYGHVLLYQHTKKFWLVTFSLSNRLIELKIHQNQYFILLFQSIGQILNLTMTQDIRVLYLPIMKLQSLKISNTLLIKRVIYYINITKNWKNDMQNTTKNLQNDLEWICIWLLTLPI